MRRASRETQTSERRLSRRGGGSRHGTLTLFLYKVSCSRCLHEKSRNLACRAWPPPPAESESAQLLNK